MSVGLQRLREEPDVVRKGAADKREDTTLIDAALQLDMRRRELLGSVEADRAQRNQWSQDVGRMIKEGADPRSGEVEGLKRASKQAGDRIGLTVAPDDLALAAEVAGQAGEVLSTRQDDRGAHLVAKVEHGDRLLPSLLHALSDKQVEVLSATLHQPTLDDVFLNLTGRSLREGAEA
jgi:ABC-2 type transport system ATP-binding protein